MGPGHKDETSKGPLDGRRLSVNIAALVAIGIIYQDQNVGYVDANYQENYRSDRNVRTCSTWAYGSSNYGSATWRSAEELPLKTFW